MASSAETAAAGGQEPGEGETRRDFLMLATGAVGALGVAAAIWPFIDQMNPAADTLAAASTELNLEPIEVGQRVVVKWRGKPVFVTRRTREQIDEARSVPLEDLVDPEEDSARVRNPELLIVIGVCTHLGCIPKGNKAGEPRGEYGGWFCPCHGSHYDTSGRIRRGPAPLNLPVPEYTLMPDDQTAKTVRIG